MQLTPFAPDATMLERLRVEEQHLFLAEPDESFHEGPRSSDDDERVAESIAIIARGSLVSLLREVPKVARNTSSFRRAFASLLAADLAVSKSAAEDLATQILKRVTEVVFAELQSTLKRPMLSPREQVAAIEDATEKTRRRVEKQVVVAVAGRENVSGGSSR